MDYLKKYNLSGKLAVVLGGLGLIGSAVSAALAEAGASVLILDINKDEGESFATSFEKYRDYKIDYEFFDCGALDNIETEFHQLLERYGCPNIFVNCSYPRTKDWTTNTFSTITLRSLRKNVDIHLNSYAWLGKQVAEAMKEKGDGGSIIHLSSIYGVVGQDLTLYEGTDLRENMSYAVIKGGITNLTRQMASFFGKYNIRVNALCPGGLEGHVAGAVDGQHSRFIENYGNKTPLKRLGKAEEVASVALFLSSDAASYVTGIAMMVDGGWTAI